MTPQNFITQVHSVVVQQNLSIYKDLFESTTPDSANDPYWNRALALHHSLNDADRIVLYEIMRQVTVDTVSNLFGILDGVSALGGPHEDFMLTSQPDKQKLNGNLQDLFLETEEKGGQYN